MRHILLVEDTAEIHIIVKNVLSQHYTVSIASTIAEAWEHLKNNKFDLILLDLTLPDGDGLKFCAMLKTSHQIPVIIISGKTDESEKIMGFTLGASDYITKPFSQLELRARVDAKIRDSQESQQKEEFMRKADLNFNMQLLTVSVVHPDGETELNLTPLEFKLLLQLAKSSDRILTRSQLLDVVWGDQTHVLDRTVDVHISNLRKKLTKSQSTIIAMPGVGYRFGKRNSES